MNREIKLKNYFFDQFKKSRECCTEELYKKFIDYFSREYEDRIKRYIDDDFVIYSIVEELEALFKLSDFDIQKVIVLDSAFEEIVNIRKKIINICVTSNKGVLQESVVKEIDNYISSLNELQNQVLTFNKEEASKICSDCLIDTKYIKDKDIEVKSLELRRMLD